MGAEMHSRRVEPDEEGLVRFGRAIHEVECAVDEFLVDGLHPLLSEGAGVFDLAVRIRVDDAARAELFAEARIFRVVLVFGFLFGVQVIEVAVELVEAVVRREKLIFVAEVILAELARGITLGA